MIKINAQIEAPCNVRENGNTNFENTLMSSIHYLQIFCCRELATAMLVYDITTNSNLNFMSQVRYFIW